MVVMLYVGFTLTYVFVCVNQEAVSNGRICLQKNTFVYNKKKVTV